MDCTFADLVNVDELQLLFDQFTRLTGFGTAILDMEGKVLVAAGWQDICTRFHRTASDTAARCRESDTIMAGHLRDGEEFSLYRCGNGLIDVAVPVRIDGEQVARLYSGQFLFEPPDLGFFRRQAEESGFDEPSYLDAVAMVPVVTEEKVRLVMGFLCRLAETIGGMGLAGKKIEANGLIVRNSREVLFRLRNSAGWPIEFVSDNVTQFAYAAQELTSGRVPYASIVHPEDWGRVVSEVDERFSRGVDRFQLEYRIVTKEGDVRWVEERATAERDEVGRIGFYLKVLKDITERKKAEETLLLTQHCVDNAFIGICILNKDRILMANRQMCRSLGYSPEELMSMSVFDIDPFVNRDQFERLVREFHEKGYNSFESRHRRKDGTTFPVEVTTTRVRFGDRELGISFAQDITARKCAEERLRDSLAEKTVLLKEVHHRVKNNLQIICSLFDLQSDHITDESSRKFVRECENRIHSLALVHEKLYQSGTFSSINFRDYIGSLARHLFSTFEQARDLIAFRVDVEDVSLEMDEAIPCGLIINELVSNALKHAFPGDREGVITIRCRAGEGGLVTLDISDNGVGLPAGLDFRTTETLGLQLVSMLVTQLRGEIELLHDEGTAVVVRFRRKTGN